MDNRLGYMGVLGDSIGNAAHFDSFLIRLIVMALWDNRHQLSLINHNEINSDILTLEDCREAKHNGMMPYIELVRLQRLCQHRKNWWNILRSAHRLSDVI